MPTTDPGQITPKFAEGSVVIEKHESFTKPNAESDGTHMSRMGIVLSTFGTRAAVYCPLADEISGFRNYHHDMLRAPTAEELAMFREVCCKTNEEFLAWAQAAADAWASKG